jgi:hypothetical protein
VAGVLALAQECSSVRGKACVHVRPSALNASRKYGSVRPPCDLQEARRSLRNVRKPTFPLPVEELAEQSFFLHIAQTAPLA